MPTGLVEISENIQSPTGLALQGATVYVYLRGTTTQATVYTTSAGTSTVTQPLVADAKGLLTGWVIPGSYDLVGSYGGQTTTLDWEAVSGTGGSISPVFNVKQLYGAIGDGVADDTSAIQAAITACVAAGGGLVFLPAGTYLISSGLVVHGAAYLVGAGRGEVTASSDGSGAGTTNLKWVGADGTAMVTFIAAVSGQAIFGGGALRLTLSGNNSAGYGIVSSSNRDQVFDEIAVSRVTVAGIQFDNANNHLGQSCYLNRYQFTYGSAAAVQGAHGLVIDGDPTGQTTQHVIGAVTTLTYNGHGVYLRATDNNHFGRLQAVVQAGGSGHGLYFANGTTTSHARKNDFLYVSATVNAESATYGNTIHLLDSEGTRVDVTAGGELNYRVRDHLTSGVWRTHEYVFTDDLWVAPGQLVPLSPAAFAQAASLWTAVKLPESGPSVATVCLRPYHWNSGNVVGIEVYYSQSAAQTSQAVTLEVKALSTAGGAAIATPSLDQSFAGLAVNDNANVMTKTLLTFSSAVAYTRGDKLFLQLRRNPADAADTCTVDLFVHGVKVIYQGTGPASVGDGPFAIPAVGT